MNKWLRVSGIAVIVAVASLLALSASAFAQTPAAGGPGGTGRGVMGFGGPQNSLVAIAAQVLGMNQTDLVTALNTGKTIADVANDKGVAVDKIVDAFVTARKAALDQAVASGKITQAQEDAMLATMRTNVTAQISAKWQPRGYGNGTGVCTGLGTGLMQNQLRGSRWNTAP